VAGDLGVYRRAGYTTRRKHTKLAFAWPWSEQVDVQGNGDFAWLRLVGLGVGIGLIVSVRSEK